MVLNRSCPAVSQKSINTSLVPTFVRYLVAFISLFSFFSFTSGESPVQSEGIGGELLGRVTIQEKPLDQF